MSPLRAPATRPDRRDGGRHGRSDTRPATSPGRPRPLPPTPEHRIRPRLLRTAVLPALVAALSGAIAVTFTVQSATPRPSAALWAVLTATAALAMAAVAAAAVGADRMSSSLLHRFASLHRSTQRRQADLRTVVDRLRRGEGPPPTRTPQRKPPNGDELDLLALELSRSHDTAVVSVVQASKLSSSVGNEQKLEVFVNLARRLQSLVQREIQLLDELENEVEDPELLKGLFHVDHLATRIRRHAENLAVLGGAISRRQWSNPVTMTEVLRSAIAEVEQYPRVKLVPPIDGTLRGHAVADVIHLLAELVENASAFSAPNTQVLLRAQHVTAGIAVEVEDRGLGMPMDEQNRMNALLADPDQVNVARLLQDGRIGLFVVSALARRHGIAVRLQSNIYGGVQAILVVPQGLLGAESQGLQHIDTSASGEAAATEGAPPALTAPKAVLPEAAPEETAAAPRPAAPEHRPEPAPAAPRPAPQPRTRPPGPAQPQPQPQPSPVHSTPRTLAPLPVRAEHVDRPNPAAARPGAHHRPRTAAPQATERPSLPVVPIGAVRGALGRPQLPRRRSQAHLAPQLRTGPPARKEEDHAIADPGLMAAFRRGIGRAEAHITAPAPAPVSDAESAPAPAPAPLNTRARRPEPQHHDNISKE
ncbi:sensor histidine kinase [Streptomyces sp. NPDC014894]|uniref:sensor histidine kinase n=1 Tax=unclassified Streptomyces TaxID=2593676 RepID=UPI003702D267